MKPIPVELIDGCRRGERRAQHELFNMVYGFMMGISKRYYSNVDDRSAITNEAFLKVLKSFNSKSTDGNMEAWCRKITMNTIIDDFRKNKRRKSIMTYSDQETNDINEATYNEAENVFASEDLEELLYRLPEMTRYVFNMFAVEGFSHAEISASLNIAEGTSKWHVSEARRQLKLLLEKTIKVNRDERS